MSKDKSAIRDILDTAAGVWLGNALGKMGKGTRRRAFRWRRGLAPLWFGFVTWLICVLWHWLIPQWWALLLIVPIGGVALAWFGPKIPERGSRVMMALIPSGLDKGKVDILDRASERLYFGATTFYLGVYMILRVIQGSTPLSGWLWEIGVLVFGGSWWYHRRVRVAGRADKYARKWYRFKERETTPIRLGALLDSKVLSAEGRGATSVLRVRLSEGTTASSLMGIEEPLASFFDLRMASVRISPDHLKARNAYLTFIPRDPWKDKIPHPVIMENKASLGSISLATMHKKFPMGLLADGEPITYELQHTLLCGETGSGKSGWIHSLMSWLAPCDDVVLLGADFGSGSTLGPWSKLFALPLAQDADAAYILLQRIFAVIRNRERELGRRSEEEDDADDSFEPSKETPWIVLIIDEFPDMLAEAKGIKIPDDQGGGSLYNKLMLIIGRIAKKARKCGIRIVLASQNGTKVDVGSKEMIGQLTGTVGLRLREEQSRNLWGPDDVRKGWRSSDLGPAQFLLKDQSHMDPRESHGKGFWVENRDRRALVKAVSDPKTGLRAVYLEPRSWSLLMSEIEDDGTDDGTDGEMIPESGPERVVLDYLRTEALEGATAKTISDVLTKARDSAGGTGPGTSEPSIYRHLEKLEQRSLVERNSGGVKGLWRAVVIEGEIVPTQRTEMDGPVQIASIQGEQLS